MSSYPPVPAAGAVVFRFRGVHALVRECPMGAKYFDDEAFLSYKAMLERDFTRRAKDEWFT